MPPLASGRVRRALIPSLLAALMLPAGLPAPADAASRGGGRPPPMRVARPAAKPPTAARPAPQAKVKAPAVTHVETSRQARREAMRQAKIPTSQQPIKQRYTPAGRQLHYELPLPGGGKRPMVVTHQTTDRVAGHGPHWEAGRVKQPVRKDPLGRDRVANDKAKVNHAR